jgi:GT2 family glycosyltransferase
MKPVSLVILTCNRAPELLRSVELALALPERPPVIVVDNGSSDDTAPRLKARFPQVKLVRVPFNMGAAARNLGVACAETPYVAFADDDTAWAPGSLAAACGLLDLYPRLAVVTARVLVGPEGREDPVSTLMSMSPLPRAGLPGPALLGFLAGASVFRRAAFLDGGGYEPRLFLGSEETLLAYDLAADGWQMMYWDRLSVHHHPSPVRDGPHRHRLLLRNALWIAWLRRPLPSALAVTRALLREVPSWRTLLDGLHGARWVLRHRRVMPARVDEWCRLIEAQARARAAGARNIQSSSPGLPPERPSAPSRASPGQA